MADLANPNRSGPLPTTGSPTSPLKSSLLGAMFDAGERFRFKAVCRSCDIVLECGTPGAPAIEALCIPCGEKELRSFFNREERDRAMCRSLYEIVSWGLAVVLFIPTAVLQ